MPPNPRLSPQIRGLLFNPLLQLLLPFPPLNCQWYMSTEGRTISTLPREKSFRNVETEEMNLKKQGKDNGCRNKLSVHDTEEE